MTFLEDLVRLATVLAMFVVIAAGPAAAQRSVEVRVGSVIVPLPAGAAIVPHPHGQGLFGGTRIRLEERLTVEVAVLPASTQPLSAYMDSIVAARNATAKPAWRLQPAVARRVGGRTAWVLRPTCGDCEAVEVYLDFPGTRLVAAWGVDGIEPLTAERRHAIAWEFVASLHPAGGPAK